MLLTLLYTALSGGGFDLTVALSTILSALLVVFLCTPVHECAHAWAADKLGDHTARYQGRLTLNPFAHIDWLGAAMIVLVGFGWAKPVPVTVFRLPHPKRDMALIALAGPGSNLVMALVLLILLTGLQALFAVLGVAGMAVIRFLLTVLNYAAVINVNLAVFNLIPLPPLDGSRVLSAVLPDRIYLRLMQYERYFYIILIVLLATRTLTRPLSVLCGWVFDGLYWLANLPFFWL